MAGENFALGITFKGNAQNFIGAAEKASAAVGSFARTAIGATSRMNSAFLSLGNSWLSQVASITGGIAGMAALKGMIDAEYRMTRFGINANMAKEDLLALRHEISAAALATSSSAGEMTDGLEIMLKKTGNIKLAREQLKLLGTVATATGASTAQVGLMSADMLTKMNVPAQDLLNTFDALSSQGKAGGLYLADFAANSSELMAAAAEWGLKGAAGLKEYNALLQIGARKASNPAEAATNFVSSIRMLSSEQGALAARHRLGVEVYEPKELAKGIYKMRNLTTVIREIVAKSKGKIDLEAIFGARQYKVIEQIAESYKKFGDFRELDKLNKVAGDGTEILRDFNSVQATTKDQLEDIGRLASKIAKENMAMPFQALKWSLDMLQAHPAVARGGIYALLGIGGAVGASVIANKVYSTLGGAAGKTAGGIGGDLAGKLGIQKVFVTNWPKSMGGSGVNGPLPEGNFPGGTVPWWNKSWNLPGKLGGGAKLGAGLSYGVPIIAGMLAADTLDAMNEATQTHIDGVKNTISANNAFLLATINKQQGANFGTLEEARARLHHRNTTELDSGPRGPISRETDPLQALPELHNKIDITVHVDKEGRSRVISEGKNTTTRIHNPGSFDR